MNESEECRECESPPGTLIVRVVFPTRRSGMGGTRSMERDQIELRAIRDTVRYILLVERGSSVDKLSYLRSVLEARVRLSKWLDGSVEVEACPHLPLDESMWLLIIVLDREDGLISEMTFTEDRDDPPTPYGDTFEDVVRELWELTDSDRLH